jgi:hypothetical protein
LLEERKLTSPNTQKTPGLLPGETKSAPSGNQQTPGFLLEARRSVGTQQEPKLLQGIRPIPPSVKQTPDLLPGEIKSVPLVAQQTSSPLKGVRPIPPGTQQTTSLPTESRALEPLGNKQVSSLLTGVIRPIPPSTQQAPSLMLEARRPTTTSTQQIPGLIQEARRLEPSYTQQPPTRKEIPTILKETTTTLLVTERIDNALQSLSTGSNVSKDAKTPIPTTQDMVDSVIASLLSPKSFPVNKEIIQSKKDSPLEAYSMAKETVGQLSQLPPSYSGYALVKIERVPEQITVNLIENILNSLNRRGKK